MPAKSKVSRHHRFASSLPHLSEPDPELRANGTESALVPNFTYIRLREDFVYLAVVMDAYSRLAIRWALERTLEAKLSIGAFRMSMNGVAFRPVDSSFRPRRAVRLRRGHRTAHLAGHPGQHEGKENPYVNAKAERFIETLKHEEVHRVEYRHLAEARTGIRTFLEPTYNRKRLHSALGYRLPAEFDSISCQRIPA